jgi:hypothetical protein
MACFSGRLISGPMNSGSIDPFPSVTVGICDRIECAQVVTSASVNQFLMGYFSQWMSISHRAATLAGMLHSVLMILCSIESKWNVCHLKSISAKWCWSVGLDGGRSSCLIRGATHVHNCSLAMPNGMCSWHFRGSPVATCHGVLPNIISLLFKAMNKSIRSGPTKPGSRENSACHCVS